jgi:hypothetical protein
MKWLTSLTGQRVAIMGKAWCSRADLIRRLRGKATPEGPVTKRTTLLVRGASGRFAYIEYGRKERYAADLLRSGQKLEVIDDFEFRKLLEDGRRARLSDRIAGQPIEWLVRIKPRRFRMVAAIPGSLDRECSAHGRVEQSFLRQRLFGHAQTSLCSVCGEVLPLELLVAAHIKPRSECSRQERLDADNIVFGVCVLGCDALYEKGFVAVLPGGKMRASAGVGDTSKALKIVLKSLHGRRCAAWKAGKNEKYFAWHAERRFQGN